VGFLPHNFNPARIFMGDGGSLLLGLLLAVSTSVVGGRADPSGPRQLPGQTFFFLAPLFIPLFILGVPILDTLFAIVRRARRGQGLATPDKGHLHHRLMEMGHGQRRTVLILWGWTALLSAFVLYPVITGSGVSYIPIGAAMLSLALYTVLHPQIRRQRGPE
jgi:UDP-GlcNAc:undecaprenyl-phosphate GlcNAc-1-phosphate transferase